MTYFILDSIYIIILLLLNIILFVFRRKKKTLVPNKSCNYAIIIPARDESLVIKDTLDAIKRQNKNMDNTYVIIESKGDPTNEIATRMGANVYIRKKPIKHTKGNAIDECLKDILKNNKHYDLYFVLDADNVISKNFIKNMLVYWKQGYEMASSYRNMSNPKNWVSICSGLLFSLQNNLMNKQRSIFNKTITLCGSGYYIDGRIIEKLNGFPFYSLTEDFEFMIFMEENNVSNIYASNCEYYDEQPITLKASIKQRTRWLKGIMSNNKKRKKSFQLLFSNFVSFLTIVFFVLLCIESVINFGFLITLLIMYLLTIVFTIILFILDHNTINLNTIQKIKCVLLNPIFLLTYFICLFCALLKKEVIWEKTPHIGND